MTAQDVETPMRPAEADTVPVSDREAVLAGVLADVLGLDRVPVDSHFFDDLGADSMLMARFCARARKRDGVPPLSMKDIYRHPTIGSLATALAETPPARAQPPVPERPEVPRRTARAGGYFVCGTAQLVAFLAYSYLAAVVAVAGFEWISAGSGLFDLYLRAVLFGAASYLGLCSVPIVAKWTLVGRWTAQAIPVWTPAYLRFWLVKTLIHFSPVRLLVGSPLYGVYLRALGARVGRGVVVLSRNLPVCTDLLTIGDGTVIRKDSFFTGYRARAGLIETGPVTIGRDVVVSEATVIDIGASLGDGAQLGHRSSLQSGQAVPAGESWHGSPAQPAGADYRAVEPAGCGPGRRAAYSVVQLVSLTAVELPLAVGGLAIVLAEFPELVRLESSFARFSSWTFYVGMLALSFVIVMGLALVRLFVACTAPRLLARTLQPDKVYPLYGFHYSAHKAVVRLTNVKLFAALFGDSSYVVPYVRGLGYDLSEVVQTGSNFGTELKHDSPYLTSVGRGTMIADGVSFVNADFSSSSFRLRQVSIGPQNFLGNSIVYPARGRTGENCLLATKVMVPIDGELRENVGLLGSPCFEIPRSVLRDSRFDHLAVGEELRRRLAAKNRYNLRTMGLFLFVRGTSLFGNILLALAGGALYERLGVPAVAGTSVAILVFTAGYSVLVERAVSRFRRLSPQFCSIYEPYFWFHERYWKSLTDPGIHRLFNGTPFKGLFWRLAGVRVGRRLFDDGADIPERTLVTIGDDCMFNVESEIQCHSQEDGTFKSDRIAIGHRCTVGIGALVHYGVIVGDGAVLDADSFVMKGSEVAPGSRWGGNPAREMGR